MAGDRVRITRDGERLILEPVSRKPGLLAVLAELEPLDEEFPDVNVGQLPLDDPDL